MSKVYVEPPPVDSTAVFKNDIFKGKVLFCTGGGSGICKGMTEAVVCTNYRFIDSVLLTYGVFKMKHGAKAAIVGRK